MLQTENRLSKMKDWEILFKEGRFVGGDFLILKIWKIDPLKYPRRKYTVEDLKIGFAVGVKISKRAVKRNRVKRQMREVVRLMLKNGCVRQGFMVSVIAKAGVLGKTYEAIETEVTRLFKRADLYQK
ncbi:MAG: ribonuclease P protein component [Candidatus Magasanikbacteria bacterium]|nr:ribonuclease P protein component [Candidatus Magasanikbacteria bacterium]